jgi:DNA polymerase-1
VVIVSGDKDFAQLISSHISMYDTMKDLFYNREEAFARWNVFPEQMVDYLALIGDSSDHIPGVNGIGPKTASQLLNEYKSLDGIYQNIDCIKSATQKKLLEGKEMAYLSQKLVKINLEIPLSIDENTLLPKPIDHQKIIAFIERYNFKSLIPTFNKLGSSTLQKIAEPVTSKLTKIDYSQINAHTFLSSNHEVLWVDTTHSELVVSNGKVLLVIPRSEVPQYVNRLAETRLAGSNLKTLAHEIKLPKLKVFWDNSIAAYVNLPGQSLEIEGLLKKYLGKGLNQFATPIEAHMALADALYTQVDSQLKIIQEIELPLLEVLYDMELRGVLLDTDWLVEERSHLFEEIKSIENKIYAIAGKEFNLNSPKQLSSILFNDLKLPAGKKTKTGFSTDNEVLEGLQKNHPIISEILQYRELSKLKSTYIDPLPQMADQAGRIHTTFQQTVTTTGRLSSINPNLQNIPIRTARGERLRAAFIAPPGSLLAAFDYSQIELRILAHVSKDPGLIRAFEKKQDIHAATASEIFDVAIDSVNSEQRRMAKAVNFGIAYGQTAFGLSQTLGIGRKQAQEIIDRYFQKFEKVKNYIANTIEEAKSKGYVETLLGRRRYIPDILSSNSNLQKNAERAAINAPMQGSAADIVKLAMIKTQAQYQSQLILQVHDELIFEAPSEIIQAEAQSIKSTMETVVTLEVPLIVNFGIGKNWKEAH